MNETYKKLMQCYKDVKSKIDFTPDVAIILGTGLGDYGEKINVVKTLDYKEIEGFPTSSVQGHKGRFLFGYIENVPVVCMQGRVHYYEGYDIRDVVLPTRLMGLLGAKALFLSNAAGGIDKSFTPGDLMLITDHISSFVPSPLIGENIESLGSRFPDMSEVYDKEFCDVIRATAKEINCDLKEGVYVQTTGPNFETPAEIKMYEVLGASAVGMSTACEAMTAKHMGMRVCGVSCISNMAAGVSSEGLKHDDVELVAKKSAPVFENLVTKSVVEIAKLI